MTVATKWRPLAGATCAHPTCDRKALQRAVMDDSLKPVCKTHLSRLQHGKSLVLPTDFETDSSWWCRLCTSYKAPTEFAPRTSIGTGKSLRRYECVGCARAAWLASYYLKTYGITITQYDELLNAQGGTCAGCEARPESQRLFVDHDHETGEVRGLLCSSCNLGLGNLKDDASRLRRLADYIDGGLA